MIPLSGEYYVECNEVFRRSTNQAERMLDELSAYAKDRSALRILSVGSGAGLFEIPMLRTLGSAIARFVGVDVNEHACRLLQVKLENEFGTAFDFEVVNLAFQDYQTDRRFEVVLFNHTFEYLNGDRLSWIQKSRELLGEAGNVLIFSPNRGGINKYYDEVFSPCFSEDLEQMLSMVGIRHSKATIEAECDLTLLTGEDDDPDKIRLLSFLTQIDCRDLPASMRGEFVEYYLSLRNGDSTLVPHPTTLFIL
ncbi:MAG: class I SAM-dependent methyltransferase [Anaerolineales bacterium]